MDERNQPTVAQVEAKNADIRATMDECELAEAFRDNTYGSCGCSGIVVTDPKMTKANYLAYSPYGFGCTYY